jgi:hypothetical protein
MHAIVALMLSESLEAERRRVQPHPRRFLIEERPASSERRASGPSFPRIPRFLRPAGRAA